MNERMRVCDGCRCFVAEAESDIWGSGDGTWYVQCHVCRDRQERNRQLEAERRLKERAG